jgi:hypothetical protein
MTVLHHLLWVDFWHPIQHWFYSSWWGQDVLAGGGLSIWAIVWSHLRSVRHLKLLHEKVDHVIFNHPDIPPFRR